MKKDFLRRAWAEIHLERLEANLKSARALTDPSKTSVACVVKANAYGHDDENIVPFLESLGVSFFAVSNIREAQKLRRCGTKGEILILGYTPPELAAELAENDIIQAAVSEEHALEIAEQARSAGVTVKLHAAVDTGMGRIGVRAADSVSCGTAAQSLLRISREKGVILDGAFTHYAAADSLAPEDVSYTAAQTELFFDVCEKARGLGVSLRHTHCLNSAGGTLRYDPRSTLYRLGIILYGLYPDPSLELPFALQPVMDLKAAVSYVKTLSPGDCVSYGRTYRADGKITAATIPIGYADGYVRGLSGKAEVLINGRRAPVIGRICMDQLMADVTGIEGVHEGSEVTLIGSDGNERITADELAGKCGTIGYEIVCGISKRIPRVIYRDGEITDVVEYY